MTLSLKDKLGPYEILSPLGAGGMGEVYRARDSKLGRDVALKVLPEAFASDAEHMARFEREAQLLASLNHPNIASVYGLEESGGEHALVMELVEGPTLAERIAAGPIPIDEVLAIARQTAEGLEYAHERGIVHRDLKPANVKVTPEGRVKVLDFGLAKAFSPEESAADISTSPTLSIGATRAGVILGTAAYMSPEQAKGKPVDRRADIWAFGCLLFEMVSGKQCFKAETVSETLATVLMNEPDWSQLPESTPPRLRALLRRCLNKDPKQRLRDIGEARIAIEEILGGPEPEGIPVTPLAEGPGAARWPQRKWLAALAAAVALVVLAAAGGWLLGHKTIAGTPSEFRQLTFDSGLIYSARFAPGGQAIYYGAAWSGLPVQLYATQPNGPESRPLGLQNSALYAVSASQMAVSIGCRDIFIGDCIGTLAVMPVSGGAPREVAENVISADWGPDGNELAAIRQVGEKFQVEFPLGNVIYQASTWMNFLRVSPRGDALAFVAYSGSTGDVGKVIILDREGREIARSGRFISLEGLAWAPRGNEVWFGATMTSGWATSIHGFTLSGKDRVVLRLPSALRLHDVSRDGRILFSQEVWRDETKFRAATDMRERDLSWLDSADVTDLSPDGKEIAFYEWGLASTMSMAYMRQTDGSLPVKLGEGEESVLSSDGKWLLVNVPGDPSRLRLLPTGAGVPHELSSSGFHDFATPGWMPGCGAVYFAANNGHGWRLYTQDISSGAPRPFTPPISVFTKGYESHLVSPDGKWAFARDVNRKAWLYPVGGGKPQPVLGLNPRDIWINWSADGRFGYVCQDEITHAPVLRVDLGTGARKVLTDLGPSDPAGLTSIVPVRVTPDAKFFAYSFDRALSNLFMASGVK
jgi:eukaryotic-like serine/threonine-protein kinase